MRAEGGHTSGTFGTRLGEETHVVPKPMSETGGRPILWHSMKPYSSCGFNDLITFMHLRRPLIIALIRVGHSLWTGALLGLLAV